MVFFPSGDAQGFPVRYGIEPRSRIGLMPEGMRFFDDQFPDRLTRIKSCIMIPENFAAYHEYSFPIFFYQYGDIGRGFGVHRQSGFHAAHSILSDYYVVNEGSAG